MSNHNKNKPINKIISVLLVCIMVIIPVINCTVFVSAEENAKNNSSSNSYVPGLAAWYDGKQNTKSGSNTNSSVWEDLISGYDLKINKNSDNYFNENGLHVKSAKHTFPSEITDIINGESFTVEILFGNFMSVGNDFNTFMNSTNDNFALFRRNTDNTIEFKFAANSPTARPKIPDAIATLPNSLITVTYEVGGNCSIYINGVLKAEKPSPARMGAGDLFIGQTAGKDYEATYKSIRFYDRSLSSDEVLHNSAVDGLTDVKDLYVSDGLVSLYSGISNTENGYDPSSKVWSDLVGSNDVPLITNENNYFTREGFHLNSTANNFPQPVVDLINGNEFTVEMVLGDLKSIGDSFNTFINSSNDNFSLFRRNSNDVLEFKYAANAPGERPTVPDGLNTFKNSTVSVTYKVGGKTTIYVDGVMVAEADSPKAMGADNLFFGHDQPSKCYETTFRSMRFYNRVLTNEEIASNAKRDAAHVEEKGEKTPSFVTIEQPKTNIAGDIALVRSIESSAEFDSAMSYKVKPAALILHTDSSLNITNTSGAKIGTVDWAFEKLNYTVMAVFEVNDTETVNALCDYLKGKPFYDCFIMSKDASLVKLAKEQIPEIRGVIDYSEIYKDKEALSTNDLLDIRKSIHANNGAIAVLPQRLATRENIQYLYDRIVNVWVDAAYPSDTAGKYDSVLSGAIGVISDDTSGLYEIASSVEKNTITRMPLNIGHRGIPSTWPENTLEGAVAAYEAGANVIEIDIYLTTDGEIVIMHDANTGRTCDKDLTVENSTLAQLKELYVNRGYERNNKKNQCRIPTLREYLERFKGTDCEIFIEIKSSKNDLVPKMKALIDEYDMYANCAVITFIESQMANMRKYYPEMSVGALGMSQFDDNKADSNMRSVMATIGKYNATLNPSYTGYGENAIRAALLRGIGVYPWTFERNSGNSYFTWGYSGITTNTPNVFGPAEKMLTIQLPEGQIAVGQQIGLSGTVTTYAHESKDVSSKLNYKVLSGENIVSVNNEGKLVFTGEGEALIIAYCENTSPMKYTLYSNIIKLKAEGQSNPGGEESSITETDTKNSEVSENVTEKTEESVSDVPEEKQNRGCKSSAGIGIIALVLASASFVTYKKSKKS